VLRRPTAGRHARPSRAGQPLLAGVLAASVGGGTLGLGATGALAGSPAAVLVAAPAAAAAPALPSDRDVVRASRQRPPAVLPFVTPPPPPPAPEPPVLPGCEEEPADRWANGRIPSSALCTVPGNPGHRLRADAARALVRLARAYEADTGREVCITDTYRSYEAQVALRRAKGRLAAVPGRSNHGDGTAVDFCGGVERFGTAAHRWMRARAGEFGFVHPTWARAGGRKPEPWHWEFRP
jgi:hypothetical protein